MVVLLFSALACRSARTAVAISDQFDPPRARTAVGRRLSSAGLNFAFGRWDRAMIEK
jgi:hypothetical protein